MVGAQEGFDGLFISGPPVLVCNDYKQPTSMFISMIAYRTKFRSLSSVSI